MPVKTTKPIPSPPLHTSMGLSPDAAARYNMVWFIPLIMLVILTIPVDCMASTPPVQPSLLMSVSDNPSDQDTSLKFLFTWNGYSSFNTPPEYIIVEVFSVADGTRLGAFPVPRLTDPCKKGGTCTYSTSVSSVNFPNGDFMLVATDPLSGAAARQLVAVNTPGEGSRDFFRRFEQEQVFIVVSVVLTAFLATILAILVREKNHL